MPYSWRVAILPYLEQNALYKQYDFDEPWDGPNNRKLLDKMPAVYSYPGLDGSPASRTNTAYFVFTGEAAALGVPAQGRRPPNLRRKLHRRHVKHDPGRRIEARRSLDEARRHSI